MDPRIPADRAFVLFDLGGTLIFDPFAQVLSRLEEDLRDGASAFAFFGGAHRWFSG